jgi:hypothetical protein
MVLLLSTRIAFFRKSGVSTGFLAEKKDASTPKIHGCEPWSTSNYTRLPKSHYISRFKHRLEYCGELLRALPHPIERSPAMIRS